MVMNMKKTNRIRIFFVLTALTVCVAYYSGYHYMLERNKEKESITAEENKKEDEKLSAVESANMTQPHRYLVMDDDGYLCVYMDNTDTLYMYTDIRTSELPEKLKEEIKTGKVFQNLEELYLFLESYSS